MHFSTLLAATSFSGVVFSWGNLGHETVALVAYQHLSSSTAQYLSDLLNYQNPSGYDFADSATWADRIKNSRPNTKPWHYIDAHDSPPTSCIVVYPSDCGDKPSDGCVISAISNHTAAFMDTSSSEIVRKEALMFIMHFIGDLHQPLHVEDYKTGGNDIHACFGGKSLPCGDIKTHNLHHIWDTEIPHKICGLKSSAKPEDEKAAAEEWATRLVQAQRADGVSTMSECAEVSDPDRCSLAWAAETNRYVCSYVLTPLATGGDEWFDTRDLGGAYYEGAAPLVEALIGKAGLRLAAWLEAMVAQAQGQETNGSQQVLEKVDL